jgi:hypothetical protein
MKEKLDVERGFAKVRTSIDRFFVISNRNKKTVIGSVYARYGVYSRLQGHVSSASGYVPKGCYVVLGDHKEEPPPISKC